MPATRREDQSGLSAKIASKWRTSGCCDVPLLRRAKTPIPARPPTARPNGAASGSEVMRGPRAATFIDVWDA